MQVTSFFWGFYITYVHSLACQYCHAVNTQIWSQELFYMNEIPEIMNAICRTSSSQGYHQHKLLGRRNFVRPHSWQYVHVYRLIPFERRGLWRIGCGELQSYQAQTKIILQQFLFFYTYIILLMLACTWPNAPSTRRYYICRCTVRTPWLETTWGWNLCSIETDLMATCLTITHKFHLIFATSTGKEQWAPQKLCLIDRVMNQNFIEVCM